MSAVGSVLEPGPAPRAGAQVPSARVAMVGGGQLARMTHQAAIALGVELRVLAASPDDPAVRAGAAHVLGAPGDLGALRALAAGCDVLTFDHERIPPEHLRARQDEGVVLAPGPGAKLAAQDKLHARRLLAGLGLPVPAFTHARTPADAERFAGEHGWPLIAKTPREGYDGRGIFTLQRLADAERLLGEAPGGLLIEPHLALDCELSVLVARARGGERVAYVPAPTVQREAMCREILSPAPIDAALAAQAQALALELAEAIDATGIMAVELFATPGGLLVNELALRPHNSGHHTIEGAVTSQFEQHLRAVLGWPLGAPDATAPAVACVNVVGPADGTDPRTRLPAALAVPGAHVHLYAKAARPGRKLGHVTVCGPKLPAARAAALHAAALLEGRTS